MLISTDPWRRPSTLQRMHPRLARVAALAALALFAWGPATAAERPGPGRATVAGHLTGVTLDALGKALPEVRVMLTPVGRPDASGTLLSAHSDEKGRFSFEDVEPGAYDIVALKGGYSVLVARINTVLEKSLELIMRPSGPPGPEGTTPPDNAWALRLPSRDRLETRGAVWGADEQDSRRGRLLLASTRVTAGGRDDDEFYADYAQEFDLGEGGELVASLRHRSRSESGSQWDQDAVDVLRAAWSPPADATAFWPRLEVGGSRRSRGMERVDLVGQAVFEEAEQAYVATTWTSPDGSARSRSLRLEVAGLWTRNASLDDGVAGPTETDASASRIAVTAVEKRTWDGPGAGVHELRVRTRAEAAHGLRDGSDGQHRIAGSLAAGAPSLDAAGRDNLDVSVIDRWIRSRHLEFVGSVRAGWIRDLDEAGSHAAGVGARVRGLGHAVLDVHLGVSQADGSSGDVWAIGLSGGSDRWLWAVSREGGTSFAPWGGQDGGPSGTGAVLLAGRDADVDRWSASIGWDGGTIWPAVRVRGSLFDAAGDLAAWMPDDVAHVPEVAGARAEAMEWTLLIDSARTGTWVEVSIAELTDDSDLALLLEGARDWRRDVVNLRQKLGKLGWSGATWHLALAFERSEVSDVPSGSAEPARLAMLDRSRFLGGVSVAF